MSFLNINIFDEYLNTYQNEILKKRLETIAGKAQDSLSYHLGKINSAQTIVYCDQLRKLFRDANEKITLWPEVIRELCLAANHALEKSEFSWFSMCAFAIRASILRQIKEQLKDHPVTDDEIRAHKIQQDISKQITMTLESLKLMEHQKKIDELLKFGDTRLSLDTGLANRCKEVAAEKRIEYLRNLVYFGHLVDEEQHPISIHRIFLYKPIDSATKDLMGVSLIQEPHLPIHLQPNFDAIYLRMARDTLRGEISDITVISTFEQQVETRNKEEHKKDSPKNKLQDSSSPPAIPQTGGSTGAIADKLNPEQLAAPAGPSPAAVVKDHKEQDKQSKNKSGKLKPLMQKQPDPSAADAISGPAHTPR